MTTAITIESRIDKQLKRVVIQGHEGAFHEIAARNYHPNETITIVPAYTFDDVVDFVEKGEVADLGLMAIENTLAGSLLYNYTLLQESKLQIIGEVFLRIRQNIMVLPGVKIEDLKEVHSHPVAIAQCRKYFAKYPHIRLVSTANTALSARNIREKGLTDVGAIASTLAAKLYNMEILEASIETNKKNFTRFLVLQHEDRLPEIQDINKVSLCFSVNHAVGSLYKVLAVLAAYNVNLTKIQSTPIVGRGWEYQFFVDFSIEGQVSYQQAIDAIRPITKELKVLGAYPAGEHFEY